MKNLAEVVENFSSKITQLRDPNTAVHGVIPDSDWFASNKTNCVFSMRAAACHFGMFLNCINFKQGGLYEPSPLSRVRWLCWNPIYGKDRQHVQHASCIR